MSFLIFLSKNFKKSSVFEDFMKLDIIKSLKTQPKIELFLKSSIFGCVFDVFLMIFNEKQPKAQNLNPVPLGLGPANPKP